MTIKTLEYIHKLLKDEEWKSRIVYESARKQQHEYNEQNADSETIKKQEEIADRFMEEHLDALYALQEFEHQDF